MERTTASDAEATVQRYKQKWLETPTADPAQRAAKKFVTRRASHMGRQHSWEEAANHRKQQLASLHSRLETQEDERAQEEEAKQQFEESHRYYNKRTTSKSRHQSVQQMFEAAMKNKKQSQATPALPTHVGRDITTPARSSLSVMSGLLRDTLGTSLNKQSLPTTSRYGQHTAGRTTEVQSAFGDVPVQGKRGITAVPANLWRHASPSSSSVEVTACTIGEMPRAQALQKKIVPYSWQPLDMQSLSEVAPNIRHVTAHGNGGILSYKCM